MRKSWLILFIANSFFISGTSYAQPTPAAAEKTCFPAINWVSKSSNDIVTIQNGNSTSILIVVTVNKTTSTAGLNVNNCGSTTHIDSGSSAVCYSSDATNPVSFKSDSATTSVSGTYQIKQQ